MDCSCAWLFWQRGFLHRKFRLRKGSYLHTLLILSGVEKLTRSSLKGVKNPCHLYDGIFEGLVSRNAIQRWTADGQGGQYPSNLLNDPPKFEKFPEISGFRFLTLEVMKLPRSSQNHSPSCAISLSPSVEVGNVVCMIRKWGIENRALFCSQKWAFCKQLFS